jgi:hypothetical protein
MDKFLSDKRLLVFIGTVLAAIGGWGIGFGDWNEMTSPNAIFGLLMILGSMLGANVTSNVLKTPPTESKPNDKP